MLVPPRRRSPGCGSGWTRQSASATAARFLRVRNSSTASGWAADGWKSAQSRSRSASAAISMPDRGDETLPASSVTCCGARLAAKLRRLSCSASWLSLKASRLRPDQSGVRARPSAHGKVDTDTGSNCGSPSALRFRRAKHERPSSSVFSVSAMFSGPLAGGQALLISALSNTPRNSEKPSISRSDGTCHCVANCGGNCASCSRCRRRTVDWSSTSVI